MHNTEWIWVAFRTLMCLDCLENHCRTDSFPGPVFGDHQALRNRQKAVRHN